MADTYWGGLDVEDLKTCARCKQELPRSDFGPHKHFRDGLFPYCRPCKRASDRASHARHKAERSVAAAERYRRSPEPYKARANARYAAKPDVVKAQAAAWATANPERKRASQVKSARRRYAEDPEPIRERWRRRHALKLGATVVPITRSQLAEKAAYWGNHCWMCGGPFEAWDHVKPLSKGGMHVLANLRPSCTSCNARKHDDWPYWRAYCVLVTSETAKGGPRCPICGQAHVSCGTSYTGTPVDLPEGGGMADIDTEGGEGLERYPVVINGIETMLKLTAGRAKLMGLKRKAPRQQSTEPSEAEVAATTQAQHKARGVAPK